MAAVAAPIELWWARVRERAGDLFVNRGGPQLQVARLRTAGWVRLLIALPFVWAPTGISLWLYGAQGYAPVAARRVLELWLFALVTAVGSSIFAIALRDDAAELRPHQKLLAAYLPAAAELASAQLFGYSFGALSSHTALWFILLVAVYRVYLGYRLGLFVTLAGLGMFLLVVAGELTGWLPPGPLLPAPAEHLGYASLSVAGSVIGFVITGTALTFLGVNYGANAVAKLHHYITESVLRRYLPLPLVRRAARGELRLDAPPERRVVTVVSVDLVGFTALSERLDPGQLATRLNAHLSRVARIAHDHGATVDKFIGDAVVIVLGAPEALDPVEQARRAVTLARVIQEPTIEESLTTRIGVATGEAVVGSFGSADRSDYTAVGEAVNLATGLESAAPAGGALVSEETARLVGNATELEPMGLLAVKGLALSVAGFRIVLPGEQA